MSRILIIDRVRRWNNVRRGFHSSLRNRPFFSRKETVFAMPDTPRFNAATPLTPLGIFVDGLRDDDFEHDPDFPGPSEKASVAGRRIALLDRYGKEVPSVNDDRLKTIVVDYAAEDGTTVLTETYTLRRLFSDWDFDAEEEFHHEGVPYIAAGILTNGEHTLYWNVTEDGRGLKTCHIHNSIAMDPDSEEVAYPWTADNDAAVTTALGDPGAADRWCGDESVLLSVDWPDIYDPDLSSRYGLIIFRTKNPQFPYFVQEWDECFTEEEIKQHLGDWRSIESLEGGKQ